MPFAAVATLAVGAYTANRQSQAGKDAARAQREGSDAQIAENARQYDQSRADQLPFLEAGYGALDRQEAFLSGDWSGFQNSPDYAWAVNQGTAALDRGAASRGNLFGGGADADRIQLGQGLATQYANSYWNKLAGQAGQAQSSAQNLGGLGQGYAQMNNAALQNATNARASGYGNSANAWSNFGNQVGSALGYGQGGGFGSSSGGPLGSWGNYYIGNNPGRG